MLQRKLKHQTRMLQHYYKTFALHAMWSFHHFCSLIRSLFLTRILHSYKQYMKPGWEHMTTNSCRFLSTQIPRALLTHAADETQRPELLMLYQHLFVAKEASVHAVLLFKKKNMKKVIMSSFWADFSRSH